MDGIYLDAVVRKTKPDNDARKEWQSGRNARFENKMFWPREGKLRFCERGNEYYKDRESEGNTGRNINMEINNKTNEF